MPVVGILGTLCCLCCLLLIIRSPLCPCGALLTGKQPSLAPLNPWTSPTLPHTVSSTDSISSKVWESTEPLP